MITINVTDGNDKKTLRAAEGLSLLEALRINGYDIYAPCGGRGTCNKCIVEVEGEGTVLSCNYYSNKDIEIILPGRDEEQILTNQTEFLHDLPMDADIFPVSAVPANSDTPSAPAASDSKGVHAGAATPPAPARDSKGVQAEPAAPENTQPLFAPGGSHVMNPFGVAVDLGTTTVALYFLDLVSGRTEKISSFMNPQRAYGADVISRINYCQMNSGGLNELQQSIVSHFNREMEMFAAGHNISTESIVRVVFAGNTTMLHLLLGEDPVSIAQAPFTPRFITTQLRRGRETGLKVNSNAEVITLPCVSAFVGADIVAGLSALNVRSRRYLFVDIGTNGEIALVTEEGIDACAAAAGPAFEGANITCGMSARNGAVSSFTGPGRYRVIGNGRPAGICGSGIIDAAAYLVENGVVDETGYMSGDFSISGDGRIYVNQNDIREIQLAKSAIYSGMKSLLNRRGLTFSDMDALYLAGGFGNYISIRSALRIGLLPSELEGRIFPVGNSAGIGALLYLKSKQFAGWTGETALRTNYIELSNDDNFMVEFAMNMNFNSSSSKKM